METADFVVIYADTALRGMLARYAMKQAHGDHELAADACQEAWLRISQARPQQKPHVYRLIGCDVIREVVAREIRYQDQVQETSAEIMVMGDGVKLLTRKEAASVLGCSEKTLDRKAQTGALRFIRHTGNRVHFLESDIRAYIEGHIVTTSGVST